ncbi:hypothetical protein ACOSQ2_007328 [Xanthoceras sorbifolium]
MAVKAVNDAIHRLQLSLLEGIRNEKQLLALRSLMSQRDYEDTMTERSIVNLCSYQLCSNSLSSSNSWLRKGHLKEERCLVWNPSKIDEVLWLFDELKIDVWVSITDRRRWLMLGLLFDVRRGVVV